MGGHPKFRFLSSTIWPLLTAGRTQIQYPHWARSWHYAIISWFLAHLQNFLHSISFEKFWKAYANETKSTCVRVRALVISLKVFWWTKTERSFHQMLPFLKLENSVKIRIHEYSPLTSLWRETRDECPPIDFGYEENAAPGTFSVCLQPCSASHFQEWERHEERWDRGQGWALLGGVQGGVSSFLTLSPSHWPWAKAIRWAFGKHDHDLLWGSMDRLNQLLKTVSVWRIPSRESWAPGLRSSSVVTWLWAPISLPCTSSVLWWNKADI